MKTSIQKVSKTHYRVNHIDVRFNERANAWYPDKPLSIRALLDFNRFIKYGALDRNRRQKKIELLEIERQRLEDKLRTQNRKAYSMSIIAVTERKLSKVLDQLAELRYNVVVYE